MRGCVDASALPAIGRREPVPEVVADLGRRLAPRVVREMRVPCGRGHHPVTEQVANHRQPLAEREGDPGPLDGVVHALETFLTSAATIARERARPDSG